MLRLPRAVVFFTLLGLPTAFSPVWSQEPPEFKRVLDELSQSIKQAGYSRVGVATSFVTEERASGSAVQVSTPHGLYFASTIQTGLVARKGEAYQVIDADILAKALHSAGIENTQDLGKLKELAGKVGGLDAIVVGSLKSGVSSEKIQLACRLLEIDTGNVQADQHMQRRRTLADEIYAGKSLEVMRPTDNGFLPIGVSRDFTLEPSEPIPLSPRTSAQYFNFDQPHPLPNPNCPYRLSVWVNEEIRPFVFCPQLNDVYVPIEPGETFRIEVQNTLDLDVRVVVFVDGVNIRGKRRELPDENCSAWLLEAGRTGRFRGFYAEGEATATLTPFVMAPLEDSVAMQQGFTDHLGQITVVILNSGWPRQRQIIRRQGENYFVGRTWNEAEKRWEYSEGWGAIAGAQLEGSRFAVGEGEPEPVRLRYHNVVRGPVLAALTIRYATQSEIDRLLSPPGSDTNGASLE